MRGANLSPGKAPAAAGVCASLPGKPYSSVEGRKPFTREEPPPPAGVCASHPGKPYSSVERRKPVAGKRRRRPWEFAPPSRESLISPSRSANLSPGKAPAAAGVCAPFPGKPYFSVEGRKPFTRKSPRRPWEFAPRSRESLILPSRGANPSPGKSPRRLREFAPHSPERLILPLRGANPAPENPPGAFSEGIRRTPRRRRRRIVGCSRR